MTVSGGVGKWQQIEFDSLSKLNSDLILNTFGVKDLIDFDWILN